jgi:geranylgeranyl diphosphate synthase type 3
MLHCRIDDMQDNSTIRRGIPAAHTVYGVPSTINAANFILLISLKHSQDIHYPEAIRMCTETMMKVYHGQGMEIYWRDNYSCPTVEEYQDMAKNSKNRVRNLSRL